MHTFVCKYRLKQLMVEVYRRCCTRAALRFHQSGPARDAVRQRHETARGRHRWISPDDEPAKGRDGWTRPNDHRGSRDRDVLGPIFGLLSARKAPWDGKAPPNGQGREDASLRQWASPISRSQVLGDGTDLRVSQQQRICKQCDDLFITPASFACRGDRPLNRFSKHCAHHVVLHRSDSFVVWPLWALPMDGCCLGGAQRGQLFTSRCHLPHACAT